MTPSTKNESFTFGVNSKQQPILENIKSDENNTKHCIVYTTDRVFNQNAFWEILEQVARNLQLMIRYPKGILEYRNFDNTIILPIDQTSIIKRQTAYTAAEKANGHSLNDQIYLGSTILEILWAIFIRWRLSRGVPTIIEQMYRTFCVQRNDTEFSQIQWPKNSFNPLEPFKLQIVTIGTSASSCMVVQNLHLMINSIANEYPNILPITSRFTTLNIHAHFHVLLIAWIVRSKQTIRIPIVKCITKLPR